MLCRRRRRRRRRRRLKGIHSSTSELPRTINLSALPVKFGT